MREIGVWSRVYGGSVAQDTTGSALGYDANSETMQSGVQWSLGEHWHLGASAAYEHTSFFGADNSSTIDGNDVLAGATVAYQLGGLVLAAGVNGGYGWYDSKRMVAFGNYGSVASASPNSWHAGVSGRVSYQLGFRNWYLKPWLDLEEIVIGAEGYVESGPAIFRLAVDSERRGNFVATPGLEIGTRSDLGARGILRPFASAGFGVISPDDWQTHARFADSPIGAASGFYRDNAVSQSARTRLAGRRPDPERHLGPQTPV
ncbi:MAG: autotransporter outer membrane beta-barrel domain-containing protein [Rhodospirillales bacterium]